MYGDVFLKSFCDESCQFVYKEGQKSSAHFIFVSSVLNSVFNQKSSKTSFSMFFHFLWISFVRLTDFLQITVFRTAHSVNS